MRTKLSSIVTIIMVGLMAAATIFMVGCESSSSDSESSGNLQVQSVTASPSAVEVGSQSIIEALIMNGDTPLSNRVIMFSVESGGTCSPSIDTTDGDGYATTVFSGTDAGISTITAWLSDEAYATVDVMVAAVGDTTGDTTGTPPDTATVSSDNVEISSNPRRLEADGVSTSQIVITITDTNGNPAPESTMVRLTAGEKFEDNDGDGYFTGGGVDNLIIDAVANGAWDPVGWIDSVAYVEGDTGTVIVTYTAGIDPIAVYVRATVDDDAIEGFAQTTIQLNPNAEVGSITMVTDSIHMAVVGTGGYEDGTIYATAYDPFGNRVPAGIPIYFIITDGPGGGEDLGGTGLGPYVDLTNSDGVAVCPISSGTISGTIRIRAYNEGATILSEATQIMVHAGPPATIIVGAEICNTAYWGIINERVKITALVSDIYHNPCPDSTVVYFSCDEGTIMAHEVRTEGEEGLAGSWWLSGYDDAMSDGIVEVYASTNGGTLADTGVFINSWIPSNIWFITDSASGFRVFPTTINADGETVKFFYVEVRDLNGNYVVGETEIDLESDFLDVASGVVQDGCHASRVKTYMTSVVLKYDYSMNGTADDGIGAIDFISANYANIVDASMPCTLLTGPAYYSGCNLDIESSVNYSSSVPFTVTIEDRWGNPLGDHTIVATVEGGGTISSGTQKTNLYGEATGFILNAPAAGGPESITVKAQDIDPRGNITLTATVTLN